MKSSDFGNVALGLGYTLDRSYALPPVSFTACEASLRVTAGRLLIDQRVSVVTERTETLLNCDDLDLSEARRGSSSCTASSQRASTASQGM